MVSIYLDKSGSHDTSRLYVVAGLVASPASWEALCRDWQRSLDAAGAPVFHTADCCNGGAAFRNWSSQARNALIKELVGVTRAHVTHRVWSAAVMDDMRALDRRVPDDGDEPGSFSLVRDAYSLCAIGCASRMRSTMLAPSNRHLPDAPYIFEQGGKGTSFAFDAFSKLYGARDVEGYRMHSLTLADRRTTVPLQAADLHAYETYRYFADQLAETGRPPRKSFLELLKVPQAGGGGYLFGEAALQTWKRKARNGNRNEDGSIELPLVDLNPDNLIRIEDVL